jgi:hypothetical protein
MMSEEKRILRVPVRIGLLRQIDALVAEGLFTSRAELLEEGAEVMVMEARYAPADGEARLGEPVSARPPAIERVADEFTPPAVLPPERDIVTESLSQLDFAPRGHTMGPSSIVEESGDGTLFGMHNNDYASLFALALLSREAQQGPVPFQDFQECVLAEAWKHAATLVATGGNRRTLALGGFPKNRTKAASSEKAFLNFAVGTVGRNKAGEWVKKGPLFAWGLIDVDLVSGDPRVGLTEPGWNLTEALRGLNARTPHEPEHAGQFLDHLVRFAPGDLAGIRLAVSAAERGDCTRADMVAAFSTQWPQWSQSMASTNASGYVSRAREWGLLEPAMTDGAYETSVFGGTYFAPATMEREGNDDAEQAA